MKRDILFAPVDTASVVEDSVREYEAKANTTLFPADPVHLLLMTFSAIIAQNNAIINYTARQDLLRYATGEYLDALGELMGVYRLQPTHARCSLKFTPQQGVTREITIPQGTRVTADGKIFFATDYDVTIAGENAGENAGLISLISATCTTAGAEGNGLMAGQISKMVDVIEFIASVENTTTSVGGTDIESDTRLRERIRMQPESYTTAGSEGSYRYWAMTAHNNISDVAIISDPANAPGVIDVYILLNDGVIPDIYSAEIMTVEGVLNDPKRRPLSDLVNVHPAEPITIDYKVEFWITPEMIPDMRYIFEGVESAVVEYEKWQTEKIGRDINPDVLVKLCMNAGVKRVVLTSDNLPFVFEPIPNNKVVQFTENPMRIHYKGVENE